MLAPFGFSVGDFITVLQLTRDVIAGLQAQGGAVNEFYNIVEDLEANITIFQQLENLDLPDKYNAQQRSIVTLAQSLYGLATDFLALIQKYRRDLTRPEARHSYRAVLKKTSWTMKTPKRLARFRTDIEAKSLSLRLLLSKINVDISVSVLKAGEASDRAHEHDRQVSETRYNELLAHFEGLQVSLQSIEAHEQMIRLHFHIPTQHSQAQTLSVESVSGGRPQTLDDSSEALVSSTSTSTPISSWPGFSLGANTLRLQGENSLAAHLAIAATLGITQKSYIEDHPSPFYLSSRAFDSGFPGFGTGDTSPSSLAKIKPDLRPTNTQLVTPHPTYLDCIIFPSFRDRAIKLSAASKLDHWDLYCDIVNDGLMCWGSANKSGMENGVAWSMRSWEARPWFLKKWWFLAGGADEEIWKGSRLWRSMRGEDADIDVFEI